VVAFPLALIAIVTRRFGFTVLHTLGASVGGELFALFLFVAYNKWEGSKLIVGETPEIVAQFGTPDLRSRAAVLLAFCMLALVIGSVIGLLVLLANWMYSRVESA